MPKVKGMVKSRHSGNDLVWIELRRIEIGIYRTRGIMNRLLKRTSNDGKCMHENKPIRFSSWPLICPSSTSSSRG